MNRRLLILAAVVALAVIGAFGWRLAFANGSTPDTVIAVSGRIEGDESAVASKITGRIVEVRVREGDTVNAGDLIARLDDQQARAREDQARVGVTGADARFQAARQQIAVLEEQLQQSSLQTEQARVDAGGRVQQAEADLAGAEADLAHQSARSASQAAALTSDDARDLVVLATGAGYLQVLASRARVESARAHVETADALLAQTSQQRAVGVSAQIDINRSQVEALTQRQRLLTLQNDLSKQKINLARLTGIPPTDEFDTSDEIDFAPAPALSADDALAEAMSHRSDLQAGEAALRAATNALNAARAERLPTVSVDADYGTIGTTLNDAQRTFALFGSVRVPLWDGGRAAGDIRQTDAIVRQRRAELESLRADIIADVRRAFLDVQSAASQVDLARTNLDTTRQTLELTRQRFQAGVTDTVDVVRSQESVAQADLDYINSVFAHNVAKLALARAIGGAAANLGRFLKVQ